MCGGGTQQSHSPPQNRKLMDYKNVRYSLTLNNQQIEALSDCNCKINRMMCLHTMLRLAGMTPSVVTKKGFSGKTQTGQFVIEMEKLGELIGGDKKTAERIVADFVRLGLIEKQGNNRTTLITIRCLSVWFCEGHTTIKNPFFNINPIVLPKKPRKVYQKKSCVSANEETDSTQIDDSYNSIEQESVETLSATNTDECIITNTTDDDINPTPSESDMESSSLISVDEGVSAGVSNDCDDSNHHNAEVATLKMEIEYKTENGLATPRPQSQLFKANSNKKRKKKERQAPKKKQQKKNRH